MPAKVKKPDSQTEDIEETLAGAEPEPETEPQENLEAVKGEAKGEAEGEKKIKVGEEELSNDELSALIAKAREVESIEKEQNIDIKQLYPDYTKKSQLLSDPVKLGGYIAEKFGAAKVPTPEDAVRAQAIKEAREVYGIVTKEDLDAFKTSFKEELETDNLIKDATEIEKEHGITKTDLFDFMRVTGNSDPYKAAEKIVEWRKVNEGPAVDKKPTFTEKSGSSGTHVPQGKKLPRIDDTQGMKDVIADMLSTPGPEEV